MSGDVVPFQLHVDQDRLIDLAERLARIRWPDRETVGDWGQGMPLDRIQHLCAYWRDGYDWRRCERTLNGLGQSKTVIDGLPIHLLHVRSPEPGALPMVLTHGWPGSVIEFLQVIGPLSDPVAHGGKAADAFHLVIPSLPGFGFSGRPQTTGWGVERIARAWPQMMSRLGYSRWVAQGGDWGAVVTTALAAAAPPGLVAAHLNTLTLSPRSRATAQLDPDEAEAMRRVEQRFGASEFGYAQLQGTRPQTLAYGLTDSPAAQAAWLYEKLWAWADHDGDLSEVINDDAVLDNVMLYWLTGTAGSAARLYWESLSEATMNRDVSLPMGVTSMPADTTRAPRAWAQEWFHDLTFWSEPERGGHFAAWEQPHRFVDDVRSCFRAAR